MGSKRKFLWIIGLTFLLTGCITEYTPKTTTVALAPGASQTFTAVSDDAVARLVWYLDGRRVAYDKGQYVYKAEQLTNNQPVQHTLVVREESSFYDWYYKLKGLKPSSITWTIRVAPPTTVACYMDDDHDGYGDINKRIESTTPPSNCVSNSTDCNDSNAAVHPGAAEVCNGIDDNCNGQIDDGIAAVGTTCGVGACAGTTGSSTCVNGAMVDSCNPTARATAEVCDGVDNDCDGQVDDGLTCACTNGQTRNVQCGVGACARNGIETCVNGQWGTSTCVAGSPSAEICNGIDDNCNGQIDDGIAPVATTCGVGACAGQTGASTCINGQMVDSCNPTAGATAEVCDGIDNNCNGQVDDGITCTCVSGQTRSVSCGTGACAATGTETCVNGQWGGSTCVSGSPTAEICDGIDNNCDGAVDNGIATQATTCGVGACASTGTLACVNGAMVDSCHVGTPGAEICNGIDDNCNGQVDENIAPVATTCGVGACAGQTGSATCVNGQMVDSCNPTAGATAEVCDGIDNNCNGQTDEGISCACTNGQTRDVQCGLGACAASGTETCVNGQWASNTCVPGTPTAEACDGIDNNCDGLVDNGVATQATTCGVGACASTGTLACVSGAMVDSCKPGTPTAEICNGIDDNCNGTADEGVQLTFYGDADNDTYGNAAVSVQACSAPAGYVSTSTDCNDTLASVHPGASETCNGVDDNCNGTVDEGVQITYYRDADGDGFGNATVSTQACSAPSGYVTNSTDCNDTLAAVHPGATETCNSIDDNCNGTVDEGVQITYYRDADGDGYGNTSVTTQACSAPSGYVTNSSDCNDTLAAVHPGATETCNSIDDNCNGTVDEGVQITYYRDADGDSYGNAGVTTQACTAPSGYVTNSTDCNDNAAAVHPGATETCNLVDDNCNGTVDEGVKLTFYRDADGDSYGNAGVTTQACTAPSGYVTNSTDCNDSLASIHPGASETCNLVDDNCNGTVDEGVQLTFYRDADGDTYGSPNVTTLACTAPSGYTADRTDCNDSLALVHPDASETCNGIDDNCDGTVDEGVQLTFYRDADSDGYGNTAATTLACTVPSGYVSNSTDCNDTLASVHPGASETCNGVDDNCNGTVDEGVQITYYRDADGDTYGNASVSTQACAAPSGYVARSGDCDDANVAVNPGATEICNNIDDNCNGLIDGAEITCVTIPGTPLNVVASDITSGLTDVVVNWSAVAGATYYNVYRAIWQSTSTYERVGSSITGTSFTFTQNWQTDVLDPIGGFPTDSDFLTNLTTYHDRALPYIFNFKAPAFFAVEACNSEGCGQRSVADAGQAEFIHTAQYSEVAQAVVPLWFYPLAEGMDTLPGGTAALQWCGADICGPGGGMMMARLNAPLALQLQLDIYYENYTDWFMFPEASFRANGYFGGLQASLFSMTAIRASGNFDLSFGAINARMFAYMALAITASATNDGYVTITYKGASYQFTLPIGGMASGAGGFTLDPVTPARDDAINTVTRQATAYPVPFSITAPTEGCLSAAIDLIPYCNRIPEPQPTP